MKSMVLGCNLNTAAQQILNRLINPVMSKFKLGCLCAGGLSKLSVWWIGLGIRVEFSRPGCHLRQRLSRADAQDDESRVLQAAQRELESPATEDGSSMHWETIKVHL